MRSSVAALGSIVLLVVGIFAISTQADISRPTALNSTANGSSAAFNTTQGVFEGVTNAAGPGVVYAGVGAFILVSCGLLIVVYGGAR